MEFVWVVPRRLLISGPGLQGFHPLPPGVMEAGVLRTAREEGFFMERRYAETHPEFKQPIPYVVIARGATALCLTRLPSQSERRLHGLQSIGVGGHINPCDAPSDPGGDQLRNACLRELHEELVLPRAPLTLQPLGLVNDDTTEVGAVHLGIVYRLDVEAMPVSIRETSAMTGRFEPLDVLAARAAGPDSPFETWSTLLLRSGVLGQACAPLLVQDGTPRRAREGALHGSAR